MEGGMAGPDDLVYNFLHRPGHRYYERIGLPSPSTIKLQSKHKCDNGYRIIHRPFTSSSRLPTCQNSLCGKLVNLFKKPPISCMMLTTVTTQNGDF
jgi:hypothetical protein